MNAATTPGQPAPVRLLDELRASARQRGHSAATAAAYVNWSARFIRFHGTRHPRAGRQRDRPVSGIRRADRKGPGTRPGCKPRCPRLYVWRSAAAATRRTRVAAAAAFARPGASGAARAALLAADRAMLRPVDPAVHSLSQQAPSPRYGRAAPQRGRIYLLVAAAVQENRCVHASPLLSSTVPCRDK